MSNLASEITVGALPGSQHAGRLGMGVKPDYRGAGIGKRLLTAASTRAREKNLERVELDVYASNKEECHAKVGKKICGEANGCPKKDGVKKVGDEVRRPQKEIQVEKSGPPKNAVSIAA
jgi:ribosomal protein S18 acetylase RimI-like enzyme